MRAKGRGGDTWGERQSAAKKGDAAVRNDTGTAQRMQCGCEECYGDGGKEYRTAENGARRKSWEKRARVEAAWRILLPYFKDVQDRAGCFRR